MESAGHVCWWHGRLFRFILLAVIISWLQRGRNVTPSGFMEWINDGITIPGRSYIWLLVLGFQNMSLWVLKIFKLIIGMVDCAMLSGSIIVETRFSCGRNVGFRNFPSSQKYSFRRFESQSSAWKDFWCFFFLFRGKKSLYFFDRVRSCAVCTISYVP